MVGDHLEFRLSNYRHFMTRRDWPHDWHSWLTSWLIQRLTSWLTTWLTSYYDAHKWFLDRPSHGLLTLLIWHPYSSRFMHPSLALPDSPNAHLYGNHHINSIHSFSIKRLKKWVENRLTLGRSSELHLDQSDFSRIWVDAEEISADRVKQAGTLWILIDLWLLLCHYVYSR